MKWRYACLTARTGFLSLALVFAVAGTGSVVESGSRLRSLVESGRATETPAALPTLIDAGIREPDFNAPASSAGDVNGDGKDDLVQAVLVPPGFELTRGGVFFGRDTPSSGQTTVPEPDLLIRPRVFGPGLPRFTGLRAVPDLNGDGISEIAADVINIRAPDDRITGATYIFFGSHLLVRGEIDLRTWVPDIKLFQLVTPPPGNTFSMVGDLAGDVNGDGWKDLVIREHSISEVAFVDDIDIFYVVPGPFQSGAVIDVKDESMRATVTDADRVSELELSDVDGDGADDLLLARLHGREVELLFGSADFTAGTTLSLAGRTPDAVISNIDSNQVQAVALTSGDVNADGFGDIVLGLPNRIRDGNGDTNFAGEVYVVFGSQSFKGRTVSIAASEHDVTMRGGFGRSRVGFPPDLLGAFVMTMDVNGDGVMDIVADAPLADGVNDKFRDFGEIYVVLGSSNLKRGDLIDIARGQQDVTLVLQDEGDARLSMAKGNRFDFNGDGFFDIGYIISTPVIRVPPDSVFLPRLRIVFGGPAAAPELVKASFQTESSRLVVTGSNLTGRAKVEVNGLLIDRETVFDAKKNRLTVEGGRRQLNLHSGKNDVVVISRELRSNTVRVKV
jgi:hypothetical protein